MESVPELSQSLLDNILFFVIGSARLPEQDLVEIDENNSAMQITLVFEGSRHMDALSELFSEKNVTIPASKESIDALPTVKVTEIGRECAICLDEYELDGETKEMPCKHTFHSGCVEKWLRMHGSCPLCRYRMPDDEERKNGVSGGLGFEVWIGRGMHSIRSSNHDTVSANDPNEDSQVNVLFAMEVDENRGNDLSFAMEVDEISEVDGSLPTMDWID